MSYQKTANHVVLSVTIILALQLLAGTALAQQFKFAFLSDTHVGLKNAAEDLRSVIKDINADTTLKFVIISGDITDLDTDDELAEAKEILSHLNKPLYLITGNHEGNWSPSGGSNFRRLLGKGRFSFNYQGYLFIGTNAGPNMLHKSPGQVPREDLLWMDSILNQPKNKGVPVVYVNHYPQDAAQLNWYEALDRLKQKNVQLILVGHGHLNGRYNFEGIPAVMGRSSMRTADGGAGYNIVSFVAGKAIFEERKVQRNLLQQWAEVPLFDHHFKTDTTSYPRPSYAINKKYPRIRVQWQYQSNFDVGTGVVADSHWVIATNTGGEIFALDRATGKKQWSFFTREKLYSTPALVANRLVVASTDGVIYCLNIAGGKLIWKINTGYPIVAKPLIQNGVLYIGSSDGHFRAIHVENGQTFWDFNGVKDFVQTQPLLYRNRLFFGSWGSEFYALDAENGRLAWKWRDTSGNRINAPAGCVPVATGGKVFIITPDQLITVFDAVTGQIRWRNKVTGIKAQESMGLAADSTQLYIKGTDGKIAAVRTADLKNLWNTNPEIGYDLCATPLLEKNGVIYVPSNSGVIAAINKAGVLLWKYKAGNSLINNILPGDEGKDVIVSAVDGKITCLQIN